MKVSLVKKTLIIATVTAAVIVFTLGIWYTANTLLLIFGGLLFAIFFQGLSIRFAAITHWPYSLCLAILMIGSVALFAGAMWLRAPALSEQIDQMRERLPKAAEQIRDSVRQLPFGPSLIESVPTSAEALGRSMEGPRKIFATAASAVANIILLAFVVIYVAAQPGYYRRGMLLLIPPKGRDRARKITEKIGEKLWWWLLARLAAMSAVGLLVVVGLWSLSIPLSMTLGLIAAILGFIPNFGPIISAIPAILLGLLQSPKQALFVGFLYWGIQIVEGYIITPMFQKRAIDMPPALIVASQILLGSLLGVFGLIFATPLTAIAILLIEELYVQPDSHERA